MEKSTILATAAIWLWQLLQSFGSYTSTSLQNQHCLNIWFNHYESIQCRQLWQLLQLLPAMPALPDVSSCWQLNLNFVSMSTLLRYLIPSARVNSLNQTRSSVSESVSEWVTDKRRLWSDLGPIKRKCWYRQREEGPNHVTGFHLIFSVFANKRWISVANCSGGSLIGAKFIVHQQK